MEHSGSSLVVGRQSYISRTSGNLNVCPNKGEVGFQTLEHDVLHVVEDQNLLDVHRCFTLAATSTFTMLTKKGKRLPS